MAPGRYIPDNSFNLQTEEQEQVFDKSLQRLDGRIQWHEVHDEKQSILSRVVSYAFGQTSKTDQSLEELRELRQEFEKLKDGTGKKLAEEEKRKLETKVEELRDKDRQVVDNRDFYTGLGTSAIKSTTLFTRGGTGYALTGLTHGLDRLNTNRSGARQFGDFALGFTEGTLSKYLMGKIGEFKIGGQKIGLAQTGILFGTSGRVTGALFDSDNLVDKKGRFTLDKALIKAAADTFNPLALGFDVASFGIAHGLGHIAPGSKYIAQLTEKHKWLAPCIDNWKTGTAFGLSNGFSGDTLAQIEEMKRDGKLHYDLGRALKAAGTRAAVDGVASISGHGISCGVESAGKRIKAGGNSERHIEESPALLEMRKEEDVADKTLIAAEEATKVYKLLTIPKNFVVMDGQLERLILQNRNHETEVAELKPEYRRLSPRECVALFAEHGIENQDQFESVFLNKEKRLELPVFKLPGHDQLQIIVPVDLANKLLAINELKTYLNAWKPGQDAEMRKAMANSSCKELHDLAIQSKDHWFWQEAANVRYRLSKNDQVAFMNALIQHLEKLPDKGQAIKQIILSDQRSPDDAWHTYAYEQKVLGKMDEDFQSQAIADRASGRITFYPGAYQTNCIADLGHTLQHEWAHLLENNTRARAVYDIATKWENKGDTKGTNGHFYRGYAKYNDSEDWAVHLGEVFLGQGEDGTDHFYDMVQSVKGTGSQYKVLLMAKALYEVLSEAEQNGLWQSNNDIVRNRINYVRGELQNTAVQSLVDQLSNPYFDQSEVSDYTEILATIGNKSYAQQMINIACSNSNPEVALNLLRIAHSLDKLPSSEQLLALAYSDGPIQNWAINRILGDMPHDPALINSLITGAKNGDLVRQLNDDSSYSLQRKGGVLSFVIINVANPKEKLATFHSVLNTLRSYPELKNYFLVNLIEDVYSTKGEDYFPIGEAALNELRQNPPQDKSIIGRLEQLIADYRNGRWNQSTEAIIKNANQALAT